MTLLILLPLLIYYIIFHTYSQNTKQKEIRLIQQLNQQATEGIDLYINDMARLTLQPLYNRSLRTVLKEADGLTSKDENPDVWDMTQNESNNLINSMRLTKKYIHSVFLFNRQGQMVNYSLSSEQLVQPYSPSQEDWFQRSLVSNGTEIIAGATEIPNTIPKVTNGQHFVFPVARGLKDIDSGELLGVIGLFTDISLLRDVCSKISSTAGEQIVILDKSNTIVYDLNERHIGLHASQPDLGLAFLQGIDVSGANGQLLKVPGGNRYMMVSRIPSAEWTFVRIIPEKALFGDGQQVQNRLILLIFAFTVLSLVMSASISYGIIKPLKRLIESMRRIERGDLTIRLQVNSNDEIGNLSKGFNKMINEIERLINDVYLTSMREKEAELNALQAQINPHFIYNTLESIRMTARMKRDMDTASMISTLGSLLRYSINTRNRVVEVKEEIEHLNNYIVLQNRRFGDKFELVLDIPNDLLSLKVIKLLFQPIVENAIYHALETKDEKGVIKISGFAGREKMWFDIEDNGKGMTSEQLEELMRHINDEDSFAQGSRGIGLRNVHERIKLYCGEGYGLRIESKPELGTIVRLELPVRGVLAPQELPKI
ncbi:cache domain-containing sensor histidine kinase [Paenibacillus pectinilyticus]|nr:sensor histidine kinase [Paenibacillus pectinilyticus]